jgi:hypothetical protein
MALNFPTSPVIDELYTLNDRVWKYNGTAWQLVGDVILPASESTLINATSTTANGTYYPVFVAGSGSNQTALVRTTATSFSFNPSTGEVASVDFNSLSDLTLKKNIEPITNSAEIISQLNPVSFDWRHADKKSFGFIAQEIEKILPEIVSDSNGKKSLSYLQLIPFLVQAIKDMQKEIDDLKTK